MKNLIQKLSDEGWNGLEKSEKDSLKSKFDISMLQEISDNGWEGISDSLKSEARKVWSTPEPKVDVISQMREAGKINPENIRPKTPAQSDALGSVYNASRMPLAGLAALASFVAPSEGKTRLERANEIIENPDYNLLTQMATSPVNYAMAIPGGPMVAGLGAVAPKVAQIASQGFGKVAIGALDNALMSIADQAADPKRNVTIGETALATGVGGAVPAIGSLLNKGVLSPVKEYISKGKEYTDALDDVMSLIEYRQSPGNPRMADIDDLITLSVPEMLEKQKVSEDVAGEIANKISSTATKGLFAGLGAALGYGFSGEALPALVGGYLGQKLSDKPAAMIADILSKPNVIKGAYKASQPIGKVYDKTKPLFMNVPKYGTIPLFGSKEQ